MATSVVVDRVGGPVATSTATFDPTRTYRFHLSRTWDPAGPVVAFVMLNPSTADAHRLDPTVRRCVGFAAAWGFGALEVVNLFAFRATDPTDLSRCRDPVGTGNDRVVLEVARRADRVVVAWGTRGVRDGRAGVVTALLARRGVALHALGTTVGGHPRHPLYVRADTRLVPWSGVVADRGQ